MSQLLLNGIPIPVARERDTSVFQAISIDVPWQERGGGGRGTGHWFDEIPVKDMPDAIRRMHLWRPDPLGCSVWFWSTVWHDLEAHWILKQLGATYVTQWVWCKGDPDTETPEIGMGQRQRSAHELLRFARIGMVPVPPPERRSTSWFIAPRPRGADGKVVHSGKPDRSYEIMETHDPPGIRRAELFARRRRAGWESEGDQLGEDVYGEMGKHDDGTDAAG